MNARSRVIGLLGAALLVLSLVGCGSEAAQPTPEPTQAVAAAGRGEHLIELADEVKLDGQVVPEEDVGDVTVSHDIVCSEGSVSAADHTVVTIRTPGTYRITGALSLGQIAVDLGDDAASDPDSVVTLVLDGVNVTCTVAPALVFYNVYEGAVTDEGAAAEPVYGARIVLADGSENSLSGSHDEQHGRDGAIYSEMSMSIAGENGEVSVYSDSVGIGCTAALSIDGGKTGIQAQGFGICAAMNSEYAALSVNSGRLSVNSGLSGEGGGIYSGGGITINGGSVYASAGGADTDCGLDAAGDVVINGGSVIVLGMQQCGVSGKSTQAYIELTPERAVEMGTAFELQDATGNAIVTSTAVKSAKCLLLSSDKLNGATGLKLMVNGKEVAFKTA